MVTKNRTQDDSRASTVTSAASQLGPLEAMHALAESLLCTALNTAIESASSARKLTNDEIANACGVSEKVVRMARETKPEEQRRPLSAVRELFLPPSVFEAYQMAKAAAYKQLKPGNTKGCATTQTRVVIGTCLGMLRVLNDVLADGEVTDDEIPGVLRELTAARKKQNELEAMLLERLCARAKAEHPDVRRED